jgi:hypothetical protein
VSEKFETWMTEFMKTPEWENDSFHWDDMAKAAFNFGLQTAAEIAESEQSNNESQDAIQSRIVDNLRKLAE